jgi:hypothetical protein
MNSAWEALVLTFSDEQLDAFKRRRQLKRNGQSPSDQSVPDYSLPGQRTPDRPRSDDQASSDPNASDQLQSDQSQSDQSQSDQSAQNQWDSDQSQSDQFSLDQWNSYQSQPDQWPSDQAQLEQWTPGHQWLPVPVPDPSDGITILVESTSVHVPFIAGLRELGKSWEACTNGTLDYKAAAGDVGIYVGAKTGGATAGAFLDGVFLFFGIPTSGLFSVAGSYLAGRAVTAAWDKPVRLAQEALNKVIRDAKTAIEKRAGKSKSDLKYRARILWRQVDTVIGTYRGLENTPEMHQALESSNSATIMHLRNLLALRGRLPRYAREELDENLIRGLLHDLQLANGAAPSPKGQALNILSTVMLVNSLASRAGLGSADADWKEVATALTTSRSISREKFKEWRQAVGNVVKTEFEMLEDDVRRESVSLADYVEDGQIKLVRRRRNMMRRWPGANERWGGKRGCRTCAALRPRSSPRPRPSGGTPAAVLRTCSRRKSPAAPARRWPPAGRGPRSRPGTFDACGYAATLNHRRVTARLRSAFRRVNLPALLRVSVP